MKHNVYTNVHNQKYVHSWIELQQALCKNYLVAKCRYRCQREVDISATSAWHIKAAKTLMKSPAVSNVTYHFIASIATFCQTLLIGNRIPYACLILSFYQTYCHLTQVPQMWMQSNMQRRMKAVHLVFTLYVLWVPWPNIAQKQVHVWSRRSEAEGNQKYLTNRSDQPSENWKTVQNWNSYIWHAPQDTGIITGIIINKMGIMLEKSIHIVWKNRRFILKQKLLDKPCERNDIEDVF